MSSEVIEGHAGERLIALSKESDLLVVGSRGHGGFMGLLLGSVTTYVVNHCRVSRWWSSATTRTKH